MRSGINVQGKVDRKEEVRTVNTKAGGTVDVANAFLVDDSGEIKLTLWADDAKNIKDGDEIKIENGFVEGYRSPVNREGLKI